MEVSQRKIEDIKPYPDNQRVHAEDQVQKIVDSILEFGFQIPILVDENNEIIAGEGRYLAASRLGMKEVPTVTAEGLDENQVKALRLADNRIGDLSWFDDDLVSKELDALDQAEFPWWKTGFDDFNPLGLKDEEADLENDMRVVEKMGRLLDEHHDYLVMVFDNKYDWIRVCEEFGIEKVDGSLIPEKKKIGIGRVISGSTLLEKIDAAKGAAKQGKK